MLSDFRPHGEANIFTDLCLPKQKELVANNLPVPLHDHVILKTLIACFNALLDDLPRSPKTPKQNSFK